MRTGKAIEQVPNDSFLRAEQAWEARFQPFEEVVIDRHGVDEVRLLLQGRVGLVRRDRNTVCRIDSDKGSRPLEPGSCVLDVDRQLKTFLDQGEIHQATGP